MGLLMQGDVAGRSEMATGADKVRHGFAITNIKEVAADI